MFDWLPRGAHLCTDVGPATWLLRSLQPKGLGRLSTFLPGGFEGYVRIFHPAGYRPGSSGDLGFPAATRWRELATARGITLGRDVTFPEVAGADPDSDEFMRLMPLPGSLPPQTCEELMGILGQHTSQGSIAWFCLWDGNGFFWSASHGYGRAAGRLLRDLRAEAREQETILSSTARVDTGFRRYFLCRGPLSATCDFFDTIGSTPNLWWPDDRKWVVLTEVDSYSTYVGGSEAAVNEVIGCQAIEAMRVEIDSIIDPGV